MADAPSSLVIQYTVLRGTSSGRASLTNGMPSYAVDDISYFDLTLNSGETHAFSSTDLLVLELEQPLEVTLSIVGNDGNAVAVTRDIGGLIVLPAKTTITVSNPARLAYTTGIGVRAIAG